MGKENLGIHFKGNKSGKGPSSLFSYKGLILMHANKYELSTPLLYYAGEYYDIYPTEPRSTKMLLLVGRYLVSM
ncbi:MAG TPA: hypothetical protein DDW18_02200 [Firmicutes bacterium]|nr:hypothetical protein [Bacillota bacterium]